MSNKSKSSVIGSTINTTGKVNIATDSVISSTNALFSAGIAGQGASLLANVISNTVTSEVEGYIKDSTITKSGDINITANVDNAENKYRYDEITNTTGNVSFAGQGAALATNVIYTKYTNTVKAYVENTSSGQTGNIYLDANSERRLDNTNIGIGAAAIGAAIAVNAISTDIRTTTHSYIDAKSKTMDHVGSVTVYSRDDTDIKNIMGTVQIAGLGAAAGVALDMTWNNNITKSEILSASTGQINAEDANIRSVGLLEYEKTNVGVSLGAIGLGGDYVLIKSGKRAGNYSQSELDSGIKVVIDNLETKAKYTPLPDPTVIETGSIARVNGNLKTSGSTNVYAESNIKGRGNNRTLSLSNVSVMGGLVSGNVGIRDVDLASNTFAGITGGTVESTSNNVYVNAKNNTNVDIKGVDVRISGIGFSGGSAMYTNSSETAAEIKDATVKSGGNVNVVSASTSKSIVDATFVTVTGGGIVAVDLAENKDTNKSVALVSGNTNIDAGGKLTVHSTANTDLDSKKVTVKVQGVGFANVSKNEVRTSTICKALIENVTGTIKTHGLDITTDYGVMSANAKSNVIAVTIGGFVNTQNSGAFMEANFKSGIDSITGLNLLNTGATTIVTAKDKGTSGFVSKGEIYNVSVGGVQFAAVSSAHSENTATVTTVLNSGDFITDSLYIKSYLKSSANAESTGTKVDLAIGVNSVEANSKDTSTMNLAIGGNNTVKGVADIETDHTANSSADLSAFGFSLLGGGVRVRIYTELVANTTGNIGGNFNVNEAKLNMNTKRESSVSKSSGSGAILVTVNDPDVTNTLTGSSVLNIKNFKSDTEKGLNNWIVNNKSDNSFEVISSDGSGGLIAVSSNGMHTTFNTSTTTNVENSDINSDKKISLKVENNATINESTSNSGGGFVAVTTNNIENTYTSGAKLAIKDTNITAKDIELQTLSDVHTKTDGYVEYVGGAGGFVAVNTFNVKNNLTQTSEIDVKNSKLYASNDVQVKALTKSKFKQKIESKGRGFVTVPKGRSTLEVVNNNKLNVDNQSKFKAGNELDVSFDSNNNLDVSTTSDARNFAGKPYAYSLLYLTVNNTLDNSGSMEAGNLVDINYMNSSTNVLSQYAYTYCEAAVAASDQGGILSRTINNYLNVNSNADITSGKDVEISYSQGIMNTSSKVAWESISRLCFGIPITSTGSYSVESSSNTYSLKDNGKIVAGQGNSRYMMINRDGTIDKATLKGFYDDDYIISDGEVISGEVVKQKILDSIKIEIDNVKESLDDVEASLRADRDAIIDIESKLTPVLETIDEINGLISNGAILTDATATETGDNAFNAIIQNDINELIVKSSDSDENKISQAQYDTIMSDYNARLDEIAAENVEISNWNAQHGPSEQKDYVEIPQMYEFLVTKDYGLTNDQKMTVATGYNTIVSRIDVTENGEFTTYTNSSGTYVAVKNPRIVDGVKTCDEIVRLNSVKDGLNAQLKPYQEKLATDSDSKALLEENKSTLQREWSVVKGTPASQYEKNTDVYSITFNDMNPKDAHIIVSGAYNNNITGNGIFSVTKSGLKIDNYSTRSLVFNRINVANSTGSGLIIGGKNHSEFADKPQAVSGYEAYLYVQNNPFHKAFSELPTSGVHYKTGGDDIVGITINNYYDVNHPLASSFDIPNPTKASDMIFLGDINTSDDFKVWNESGSLLIGNNQSNYKNMSLIVPNSSVLLLSAVDENVPFIVKDNDYIFARDALSVWTQRQVILKGTVDIGYTDRSITITDDMIKPENLILDVTSGKQNMINLGSTKGTTYLNATNNIKAIYEDGQIYLYNLPESEGTSVAIICDSKSITGHVTMADQYQNITIDNRTSAQLNIADVINTQHRALIADDVYNAFKDKITINTVSPARTTISSTGKLSLNGIIYNNLLATSDKPQAGGVLSIRAENGLDIKQQIKKVDYVDTIVDSILAGGDVNIAVNSGQGDINGQITTEGVLNISNLGSGTLNIKGDINNGAIKDIYSDTTNYGRVTITNETTGILNINGNITETDGSVYVRSNAQTNITGKISGNRTNTTNNEPDINYYVYIESKGLDMSEASSIYNAEGRIRIINNPYESGSSNVANMVLNGAINANNGTVRITNNGNGATIGSIKTVDGAQTVVGSILDERGDIIIENAHGDMVISANIMHDNYYTSANGMISITNTGDNLTINSPISTTGAGKLVNNGSEDVLTAILIDNQSINYGLNLNSKVSARKGEIIIKNENKNMLTSGEISVTEHGGVSITNSGDVLTDTAKITVNSGDVNITNNGSGQAQIGGSITNRLGNTTIANTGEDIIYTGMINNADGNVTVTNASGVIKINGDISNKGGDITITNNGSYTEISNAITNQTLIESEGKKSGNIKITNNSGDFKILDTAVISNKSHEANKGITILNSGDYFQMAGVIKSLDKGYISVVNSGMTATITGDILAKGGNIGVTNSNAGELVMSGTVTGNNGNIYITNGSDDGAQIGGYIIGENGNIEITNMSGNLSVTADEIALNSNTTEGVGSISITNYEDAGTVDINAIIYNDGKGDDDGYAIIIDNQSTQYGMSVNGSLSARLGKIEIKNASENLSVAGMVSNYEQGGINIINSGKDLQSTAKIITKKGDINLTNNGTGKVQLGGEILNQNGNTTVINNGENLVYTGSIDNTRGDVSITNKNGLVHIYSDISNKGGDITINNEGSFTEIKNAKIKNETLVNSEEKISGNITIQNEEGIFRIEENALISNNSAYADKGILITNSNSGDKFQMYGRIESLDKGAVSVINNGEVATITGDIYAKEGSIGVTNSNAGELVMSGTVTNNKGNITIFNNSDDGAQIGGLITGEQGDIEIGNNGGNLAITAQTTLNYVSQDSNGKIIITNSNPDGNNVAISSSVINYGKGGADGVAILVDNYSASGGTSIDGTLSSRLGDIVIRNAAKGLSVSGMVSVYEKGGVNISNTGENGTEISGTVLDREGNINITNSNTGENSGIKITTTAIVSNANGVANVTNKGGKGITVEGYIIGDNANININNENSDITIGEYDSNNDKYIDVTDGNVIITQTNGNIINGIVDQSNSTHTNHDLANPNHAYKTLIATTNDLTINVTDGDIGKYSYSGAEPGFSVDAKTRDFTDSVNINVGGNVVAKALNNNETDARLINIRAKESDLNIKDITSDGNVLITASDWKQADTRPTPDEKTDKTGYYTGYSVLSTAEGTNPTITGQNISVISSNNIGTDKKRISYMQDTVKAPQATVSFEAENDINITGGATAVGADTRIYQLITKRGSIDFDINSDADIKEITAGKGIKITQKAQNLTIRELGMPDNPPGNENYFDDILNPHDDLEYAPRDPSQPEKLVIPNYVVLRVLDAMDTKERAESNLIVYSLTVKGNHGENAEYYPDGSRLADVTMMADNIYASSYKAPNSDVHTKDNPNGVKLHGRTYTNSDMDPSDTTVHKAKGINSFGDGEPISVDILGVDKDFVESIIQNPQRSGYIIQKSKTNVPDPFRNKNDRTKFYNYDFKADNVYVSVNDYATENRGVSIDTVYADNAYINTHDTNLVVEDGYINNYAEFRNKSKLAVVDNDFRRIVDSDMQLYTQKTGSFAMRMSNSTIMHTTAPVVDFNPYHLVNNYSSENSFVNLTFKETAVRQHNKDVYKELEKKTDYYNKSVSLVFNTLGYGLLPDDEIFEVSKTGAVIDANDLKVGEKTNVKLQFNDIDIDVETQVKEIHGDKATVEFLNIPEEISNTIMYEYMKKLKAMKNRISSL